MKINTATTMNLTFFDYLRTIFLRVYYHDKINDKIYVKSAFSFHFEDLAEHIKKSHPELY
jgi:hypothetical protein